MAWNGSDGKRTSSANGHSARGGSPRRLRWLAGSIAGLAVVVGAIAVFIALNKDAPVEPAEPEKPKVQNPEPPPPPPPAPKPQEAPKPVDPNARPTKIGEELNGYIKLPSGRLHKVHGVITNNLNSTRKKAWYEVFDHHTDNEIAFMLTMKPGQGLVGTPHYNGRFKKEFLRSLKTPIVITKDDTPEQVQIKQEVIAAREELKKAMDRGEDVEQIMLDARREYQDLAKYKVDLQGMLNDLKKDENLSDQDIEEAVSAANKMLEEKGIAPMFIGPLTRQKIRMERQLERQKGIGK